MARQKSTTRKRLVRLAYECGFDGCSDEGKHLEIDQLLNEVPDDELPEIEDALEGYAQFQEALRSPN